MNTTWMAHESVHNGRLTMPGIRGKVHAEWLVKELEEAEREFQKWPAIKKQGSGDLIESKTKYLKRRDEKMLLTTTGFLPLPG